MVEQLDGFGDDFTAWMKSKGIRLNYMRNDGVCPLTTDWLLANLKFEVVAIVKSEDREILYCEDYKLYLISPETGYDLYGDGWGQSFCVDRELEKELVKRLVTNDAYGPMKRMYVGRVSQK